MEPDALDVVEPSAVSTCVVVAGENGVQGEQRDHGGDGPADEQPLAVALGLLLLGDRCFKLGLAVGLLSLTFCGAHEGGRLPPNTASGHAPSAD